MLADGQAPIAGKEIRRFSRRVATGLFLAGFVQACAALAVALALTVLVLRMFDAVVPPHWSLTLLFVPALLWGLIHARRLMFSSADSAQHLDQRLGMRGLLMAGLEVSSDAWRDVVARRLRDAAQRQPVPRAGRLFTRAVVAAGMVVGVMLLPEAPGGQVHGNAMVTTELLRYEEELKLLLEAGAVREEEVAELRERLDQLKQKHKRPHGQGTWTEMDAFGEKLKWQRSRRQDVLSRVRKNLRELTGGAPGKVGSQGSLRALAEARDLGLLTKLPKDLGAKLENVLAAPGTAGKGGKALLLTPEELELLVKALADAPAVPGAGGEGRGRPRALAERDLRAAEEDLKKALRAAGEGGVCEGCQGGRPGRGGINRGPGHATLDYDNDVKDLTDGLQSRKLPPGASLPKRNAQTLGLSVAAPQLDPKRAGAAGAAGTAGEGEAAWRRRMAPRHREAVRRFFLHPRANDPPRDK